MKAVFSLLALCALTSAAPLPAVQTVPCVDDAITLRVKPATWNVDNVLSFSTRGYFLNDAATASFPGPMIRMKAGSRCEVTIVNELPAGQSPACAPGHHSNTLLCPDTTNLHTHGLHVSPYQDDIDTSVFPDGDSHTYTYDIPENHLMGTHWYHAHHHGSTNLQVSGGLVGMLIVDPADSYTLPADLAALYDDANTQQYFMAFQHIWMTGDDAGNTPWDQVSLPTWAARFPDQTISPNPVLAGALGDFYAVNGAYQPDVAVEAGSATLLRMVHGGGARSLILQPADDRCTMTLLSRDGVFHATPFQTLTSAAFLPGTRSDIAITCDPVLAGTTVAVAGILDPTGPYGTNTFEQAVVFNLVITDSGTADDIELPSSQPPMPSYLDSLLTTTADPLPNGATEAAVNLAALAVNGQSFLGWDAIESGGLYTHEFCLNRVVDVALGVNPTRRRALQAPPNNGGSGAVALTGVHPYHHHINHFQLRTLGVNVANSDYMRVGEWRDVTAHITGAVLAFPTADFVGPIVMHCHILQHEDVGMMGLYNVTDCDPPADTGGSDTGDTGLVCTDAAPTVFHWQPTNQFISANTAITAGPLVVNSNGVDYFAVIDQAAYRLPEPDCQAM